METVVKTKIIRIGNSQGIRIPKLLLEQSNLGEEVELAVQDNKIVIRSVVAPRHGWEEQFKEMADHGDDKLLDDALLPTEWDEEWEWS
ncbi:MAG: AbrB/MazE/SpoVT family DNA-binding domain-containing protein [Anaerolineales bacterium]|nr:AbrB/MazE/SpoVT family DNA-binding domain-containing protein [Anaerolineales bacterium]